MLLVRAEGSSIGCLRSHARARAGPYLSLHFEADSSGGFNHVVRTKMESGDELVYNLNGQWLMDTRARAEINNEYRFIPLVFRYFLDRPSSVVAHHQTGT